MDVKRLENYTPQPCALSSESFRPKFSGNFQARYLETYAGFSIGLEVPKMGFQLGLPYV